MTVPISSYLNIIIKQWNEYPQLTDRHKISK